MPKPPSQLKPQDAKARRRSMGINRRPLSINELVGKGNLLNELEVRRGVELEWLAWLRDRVPGELSGHLTGASPRGEQLIIYVDAAAWGGRLRYALQPKLAEISAREPAIRRLLFRTRAPAGPRKP